ncbi:MAG: MFS transporter, partial [Chloroflexota bacterium]
KQPAPSSGSVSHLIAKLLTPDLLLAFGGGAVLSFAQLYFHLRFHLDPGTVGIVVAVGGSAAGLATLLTPIVARRWGNLRTAVRAQWSAAPFIVVMALTMRFEIALPAYCLLLMLRGMADPVYTGFVQERVPETHRARVTGLYSVTYSIGYSLGPAASGALQTASGFGPAFLMGAVVYFTGASLLFGFFREGTRPLPVAGGGQE